MTCPRSHTNQTPFPASLQADSAAVTAIQTARRYSPAAFKRALVLPSSSLSVTRHSLQVNHRPETLTLSQYTHEDMRLPRKVKKKVSSCLMHSSLRPHSIARDCGLQISGQCMPDLWRNCAWPALYQVLFLTDVQHLTWRRQWHPTPVLLPGKSHGRRSLVGCSP